MTENSDVNVVNLNRPQLWRVSLWCIVAAMLLSAPPRAMAAPKLCIPQASGVPALGGVPNWYNAAAGEPQFWPRLDDPRWRGSLAKSWGTGASEHVQFRAVRDDSALYLSWWVRVDPHLDQALDQLYVAFSPGDAADQLITITPLPNDLATSVGPIVAPSTSTRLRNGPGGTFGSVVPTEPAWLGAPGKTRVWLDAGEHSWAINMVVPIAGTFDQGIPLQDIFKMWFELQVSTSGAPDFSMVSYRLVDTVTYEQVDTGTNTNNWAVMSRTHSPSDVANCIQAISIGSGDVGTNNVDSNNIARPNRINLTAPNTFFARPTNGSTSEVLSGQICAQFRLANWGTQPDWNDVPNPTTSLWKLISEECGKPGQRTNPAPIPAGTKADAVNQISFNKTLTQDERCEFIGQSGIPAQGNIPAIPGNPSCPNPTPTRRLHQCMLVELSAAAGGGGSLTFSQSSVYRNMDFVDASVFEREAEVSVAGLVQVGGAANRDVYLYVKTLNMPTPGSGAKPSHVLRDLETLERILARKVQGDSGSGSGSGPFGGNTYGGKPILGRSPNEPFEVLEQVLPNYVIHAYHDTLKTVTRRDKLMKVLQPQSSFGYYVLHDGPLAGWSHALAGAQLVGPDFYRIGVPQGGSKVIKTKIVSVEQTGGGGGCCRASGGSTTPAKVSTLGLSLLIGVVVVRWRRRR